MTSLLERLRGYLRARRVAYIKVFSGPNGQVVLEDLARFCRANQTCFHQDARLHAMAEGRREVWLRIQEHLQLTDDQLWAMHAPAPSTTIRSTDHERPDA